MNDFDKLTKTLDDIGIEYTVRESAEYKYLFFGECRNIYHPDMTFENGDLDRLLVSHQFIEFEDGNLASYSNS